MGQKRKLTRQQRNEDAAEVAKALQESMELFRYRLKHPEAFDRRIYNDLYCMVKSRLDGGPIRTVKRPDGLYEFRVPSDPPDDQPLPHDKTWLPK